MQDLSWLKPDIWLHPCLGNHTSRENMTTQQVTPTAILKGSGHSISSIPATTMPLALLTYSVSKISSNTASNMDLEPYPHLTLLFQAESLHVATRYDGLYNSAGSLFLKAPSGGFTSDGIGTGFDASAKYVYHKYFVVQAGVGHFFPGQIMTHNSQGAPLTISWLQFTYRFKMN